MKNLLFQKYSLKHQDFLKVRARYPDQDMAGPFLMSPNNLYAVQPNRLLIVGQESGGWAYHVDDLEKQMAHYEKFNLGESYYPSPFWNITRKVEAILGNEPYSCAWTNLSKFDLNNGRAQGEYEAAISSLDNILVDEIKITDPKICLFYTGPDFDHRISRIFEEVKYKVIPGYSSRELCQLEHKDLPEMTFRSYHPKYLRIRGLEKDFMNFISEVKAKISKN